MRAAQSPYEAHRGYVLSVLARRCRWLDPGDQEAAFHDAYAVMLAKERDGTLDTAAMGPHQVRAYLVQTAIHKALDEGKRAHRKRSESLGEGALEAPDDGATPEDLAAASLDSAVMREIIAELSDRQQSIVKLRFFFDRTPDEIQDLLGLTERVYRRELERALRTVSERHTLVREGRFCDSRRSVILAYVAGIAGPNRVRDAREHLRACRGCAQWAAGLRSATQNAAVLVPLPAFSVGSRFSGMADVASSAHQHIADLAVSVKHHAVALGTRVDPSAGYLTGARPGAVAAVVAGCIAVGGGATYCTLEGLPAPLRNLADGHVGDRKPAMRQSKPTPVPIATPRPASTPAPKSTSPSRRRSSSKQGKRNDPTAVAREFGLEGAGQPSSASSAPARPVPPPRPPSEFDP